MIPKEKAIELFDKFDNILFKEYDNLEAKKCALIAVDEIINELLFFGETWLDTRIEYWQEVKQEIENI